MTDILDTVKAQRAAYDKPVKTERDYLMISYLCIPDVIDSLRALVERCEQAEELAEQRQYERAKVADDAARAATALERERHADEVEAAFRSGWRCYPHFFNEDEAWLASEARQGVARDNG